MTAHVFVVDSTTFAIHLKYNFVGTGSKENNIDFNDGEYSSLHHKTESTLVAMMADGSRLKRDDHVYFYLVQNGNSGGKFYGVFRCVDDGSFLDLGAQNQYLLHELGKSLEIRAIIEPEEVYPSGISEWELLDDLSGVDRPNEMIWSLIYRKLKGNRGNTMITLFEEQRLLKLLKEKNLSQVPLVASAGLDFNESSGQIIDSIRIQSYLGSKRSIKLLPRLKSRYEGGSQFEAHLQAMLVLSIASTPISSFQDLIFQNHEILWLGNEVSCGVGMQRIDILAHSKCEDIEYISPIELKSVPATSDNFRQLQRYIDWLRLYYTPIMDAQIRPILVTRSIPNLNLVAIQAFNVEINAFNLANSDSHPLVWLTYCLVNGSLVFRDELAFWDSLIEEANVNDVEK